jgi:hypothetical protein
MAEAVLERARGVVEAGMHDLAVAAGGLDAVAGMGLEEGEGASVAREAGRERESDDAGADDGDIDLFHQSESPRQPSMVFEGDSD